MAKVPPDYLLYLFRQPWIREWPDLHDYLVKNQDAILLEDAENQADQHSRGFDSLEEYERYR